MSKYGHRTHDWFEAIVNKLGGEDGAERFLRGERKITDVVVEKILRLRKDEIPIPAITSPFVFAENFIVDTSAKAKVKISWVDPDIKRWGMDHAIAPRGKYEISRHELVKDALFSAMIKELRSGYETDFAGIFHLMSQQPNGEKGLLSLERWNLFFVDGRAVYVYWHGVGWGVGAGEVSDPCRWGAGDQVFTRIS